MTTGYTLDKLPKGLDTVLSLQTTGFWGRLGKTPANPDFSDTDVLKPLYTCDPWLGCVFGTSCRFCYVPSVATRLYPDGKQGYWYQQWGNWLLYKPDFTSPKTDPLIPIPDALQITARNLDVFLDADIFLMIQTRSKAVAEHEPDIFNRIVEIAKRKKVGVSFSISTDLSDQQRRIERGGSSAPSDWIRRGNPQVPSHPDAQGNPTLSGVSRKTC